MPGIPVLRRLRKKKYQVDEANLDYIVPNLAYRE